MTKKKFAELELSLLHLQQNVEIPDTTLVVHPAIAAAVERARAAGERVSPSAVEPQTLVTDPAFLTSLQQTVSTWIKAIQSTTRLSRDPASGTASQEVNFWLSMERALEGIESQLRGDGVALTLDVLKEARRFHATVSFVSDTGLKEAMSVGASPSFAQAFRGAHHADLVSADPLSSAPASAQLQPADEGLPAQRPPGCDRPAQDCVLNRRHLPSHFDQAQTVAVPDPARPPARHRHLARLQRRPPARARDRQAHVHELGRL
jgi:hypothetical protein